MITDPNKIVYGLKNVHYAAITEYSQEGHPTYALPKPIKGGVKLSLNPLGDETVIYADDCEYLSFEDNLGYEGEIEIQKMPDDFETDCLGVTEIDGVRIEKIGQQGKDFALMFEFTGDKRNKRHTLYCCKAKRPKVESSTKADKISPSTTTLSFKAKPRISDGLVKSSCENTIENASKYANWYSSVYEPNGTVGSLTVQATQGTAQGSTKITVTESVSPSNKLCVKIGQTPFSKPVANVAITGTQTYTSGADLTGVDAVTNKYVGVYELTSTNLPVKFASVTLSSSQIKA